MIAHPHGHTPVALGMLLAVVSAYLQATDRRPGWLWHPALPAVSWALAAAAFVAVSNLGLPLTLAAVRGERSRAALAPRVAALQRRYGRDRTRFASELTALYRSAGISPLALDEFLTGERTLRSDVLDRLAGALGYVLQPKE